MKKTLAIAVLLFAVGCAASARAPLAPRNPTAPVLVYTSASCGDACFALTNHLRSRGVAHMERDVNLMPGAADELARKLDEAGLTANRPPVLDFRGTILVGYDQMSVDALCDADHRAQSQLRTRAASR
jgi:hypothetical protein